MKNSFNKILTNKKLLVFFIVFFVQLVFSTFNVQAQTPLDTRIESGMLQVYLPYESDGWASIFTFGGDGCRGGDSSHLTIPTSGWIDFIPSPADLSTGCGSSPAEAGVYTYALCDVVFSMGSWRCDSEVWYPSGDLNDDYDSYISFAPYIFQYELVDIGGGDFTVSPVSPSSFSLTVSSPLSNSSVGLNTVFTGTYSSDSEDTIVHIDLENLSTDTFVQYQVSDLDVGTGVWSTNNIWLSPDTDYILHARLESLDDVSDWVHVPFTTYLSDLNDVEIWFPQENETVLPYFNLNGIYNALNLDFEPDSLVYEFYDSDNVLVYTNSFLVSSTALGNNVRWGENIFYAFPDGVYKVRASLYSTSTFERSDWTSFRTFTIEQVGKPSLDGCITDFEDWGDRIVCLFDVVWDFAVNRPVQILLQGIQGLFSFWSGVDVDFFPLNVLNDIKRVVEATSNQSVGNEMGAFLLPIPGQTATTSGTNAVAVYPLSADNNALLQHPIFVFFRGIIGLMLYATLIPFMWMTFKQARSFWNV